MKELRHKIHWNYPQKETDSPFEELIILQLVLSVIWYLEISIFEEKLRSILYLLALIQIKQVKEEEIPFVIVDLTRSLIYWDIL